MRNFLLLQLLFVVNVEFSLVSCQLDQTQRFPAPAHYQIQQSHQHPHHEPTTRPQELKDNQSLNPDFRPKFAEFNWEKFNQQTKDLQEQIHLFNLHQQNHIQTQINNSQSVQQFNYANGSLSDLEKTSEHFVNLGQLAGTQNMPAKVMKITKSVAVKQPVPVPYPASPSVEVAEEQELFEYPHHEHHQTYHGHSHISTTVGPLAVKNAARHFKYGFENKPTLKAAPAEIFQHLRQNALPAYQKFNTTPYYIITTQNELIKIVPVPFYSDENVNKHEIATPDLSSAPQPPFAHEITQQTSDSHATSLHSTVEGSDHSKRQLSSASSEKTGNFGAFTFSYNPPTPNIHPQPSQYAQQAHNLLGTKYFYNHNTGSSAAALKSHQYATEEEPEENSEHQPYEYNYLTYE